MTVDGFHRWVRKRGRSKKTADEYRNEILRCMRTDDLTDRLLDDDSAPNSRRLTLAALRAWARYGKDMQLRDELDDIRLPPPDNVTEKRPLTLEQWRALREVIEDADDLDEGERAALLLLCRRGLRVSAITALPRNAVGIALRNGTLVFATKGRTLRYGVGPIRDQLEQLHAIRGWGIVADLISPTAAPETRIPSANGRIWRVLRRQAEKVGIDKTDMYPHRLRHTVATEFYRRTKDIRALQAYMQWAKITTAARYVSHLDRDQLDELAERILDD